ncbi:ABC transporter permease [Microscilla marina]|uniref:Peptide ABC transporter, permease protein n=1 Tax=Microscilla marina ATCC 23134 TaxID=313606 RepID=A1ZZ65_MICM2|nr:ABC transporter permease [Microscilla marina]EAY24324.1 peptide ABC transporter, permease protein [Microscilla marina ATCC 23134]
MAKKNTENKRNKKTKKLKNLILSGKKQQQLKTPYYYVKKRLFANIPAVFGMIVICIAVVIALLGYSIMPDNTPNANDRVDQIKQQPPGFRARMLKIRKDRAVKQHNFFYKLLFGQESDYRIIPLADTSYQLLPPQIKALEAKLPANLIDSLKNKPKIISFLRPKADFDNMLRKIIGDQNTDKYLGTIIKQANQVLPYQIDGVSLTYLEFGGIKSSTIQLVDVVHSISTAKDIKVSGNRVTYYDLKDRARMTTAEELKQNFVKHNLEYRTFILGTDHTGRDMLSRLLFGVRISLGIGLVSVAISLMVGLTLGSLAGFFGGMVDSVIMWFMTVVWSIPGIMLVIAISLALQSRGVWVAFVAVGLTTWVEIARVVRGQILSVKEKLYIEAARALGMRSLRIIRVHIWPNIIGPLIVIITSNFASAILIEAGLSFLGLGVAPPMPSWGIMVADGFRLMTTPGGFYLVFFPSFCISLMVLAFNLFGNGLRDAFDPKTITR